MKAGLRPVCIMVAAPGRRARWKVPFPRKAASPYLRPAGKPARPVLPILRSSVLLSAALTVLAARAQHNNDVPFQRDIYVDVERNASQLDARSITGLKPVIAKRVDLTNVMGFRTDSAKYYYWLTEKIFKDHLFLVEGEDFRFAVDFLFQFEYGQDPGDPTIYADTNRHFHNARGFRVQGDIGNKISFQTMFHENQAIVPQYLFRQVLATGVMSGQGRVKIVMDRKLDYGWSEGNVCYGPVPWLNVQLGHGRHFVGHGYRSVLLSDHAINAPYLKFSAITNDRRLQYTTWHTKQLHALRRVDRLPTGDASESLFHWMRARYHHLGLRLGRVELGLFEATLFRNIDENGMRPFDPLELNPVIGVNTLVNGFDGDHKNLVGADLRVKLLDKAYVYGQFGMDQPGGDRHAWQAGIRLFDVVRKDFHVQVEHNTATPFMYMSDPARGAFMHAGLPLAHPMGAHFEETVAIVDLGFDRFRLQAKANVGTYHLDPGAEFNEGGDLLKPDRPEPSPDGPLERRLACLDLNASYLLNPVSNLRFVVGFFRRDLSNAPDNLQSGYVYASLRTGLFNRYYDL